MAYKHNTEDQLRLTPLLESPNVVIPPTMLHTAADDGSANDVNPSLVLAKSNVSSSKKPTKTRSAFVTKVWTMVNDPDNSNLISWSPSGDSFIVHHREQFVNNILPKYFKHSNFASFVRQLNMYGWHKVQDVSSGSLLVQGEGNWGFVNPYFQKGRADLLDKIVRNKPNDESGNAGSSSGSQGADKLDVSLLINELGILKSNQLKITQELSRVRQDNELLWSELFQTREKSTLQNDKIEKILQFLASVYGNRVKQLGDDNYINYIQPQLDDQQFNQGQEIRQYHQPINSSQLPPDMTDMAGDLRNFKPRLMLKEHRHVSNSSQQSSSFPGSHSGSNSTYTATPLNLEESPVQEIVRSPSLRSYPESGQDQYQDNPQQQRGAPFIPQQGFPITQQSSNYPNPVNGPPGVQPSPTQSMPQSSISTPPPGIRPPLKSAKSFHDLSKSIEQQGQDIEELITKLHQQQSQPNYETPSENGDNAGNFDLNEFLEQDFLENENNADESTKTTTHSVTSGPTPAQSYVSQDQYSANSPSGAYLTYPEEYQRVPAGEVTADGFKVPQQPSSVDSMGGISIDQQQYQQPHLVSAYQQQQPSSQQQYPYYPTQQQLPQDQRSYLQRLQPYGNNPPQQYPPQYPQSPEHQLNQQQLQIAHHQQQGSQNRDNATLSRPPLGKKRGTIQVIDNNVADFEVVNPNEVKIEDAAHTLNGNDSGSADAQKEKKRHVADESKSANETKKRKSDVS